jgi:hypothetical protein
MYKCVAAPAPRPPPAPTPGLRARAPPDPEDGALREEVRGTPPAHKKAATKAMAPPRGAQRTERRPCALDAARCAERRRAERERCAALAQAPRRGRRPRISIRTQMR